jgi:hypothetical protein
VVFEQQAVSLLECLDGQARKRRRLEGNTCKSDTLSQGWATEMSGYAPGKCARSQTKSQRPTARRSDARRGRRSCGASIDRPVWARISTSVIRGSVGNVSINAAHRGGMSRPALSSSEFRAP